MKTALAALAMLVVALAPGATSAQLPAPQVILENPSVRVSVTTLPPGIGTGRHQGLEAEVGIVIEGEMTLESPLVRPARFYEIFLKRCD